MTSHRYIKVTHRRCTPDGKDTYQFHYHGVHGWCRDRGDVHDNSEADYFDRVVGGPLHL
jgi:hypothetical protein